MKIFLSFLIICLFCHTKAFQYPGFEPHKTTPEPKNVEKANSNNKEMDMEMDKDKMDWDAVSNTYNCIQN